MLAKKKLNKLREPGGIYQNWDSPDGTETIFRSAVASDLVFQ